MGHLSLDYYDSVFRNNPQRLASVKELLLKDFKNMEEKFFAYAAENDIAGMRGELHKIQPIVFNLGFSRMVTLLEQYRRSAISEEELNRLNTELRHCLTEIFSLLERDQHL